MCILCNNDNIIDGVLCFAKTLNCSFCPLVTFIPLIVGLQTLLCNNCPLLKNREASLPLIKGLRTLYCYNCPFKQIFL